MEKNKNRTDLLAAGRKKLQQFRQKKDGKGNSSKPSSKGGKSGRDTTAGTVAEAAVTQQNVSDGEISKHDTNEHDATMGTSTDEAVAQQHDADGDRFKHDAEDTTALPESDSRVDTVASDTASSKSGHVTTAVGTGEAALTQGGEKYADDTIALSELASRVNSAASDSAAANDEPSVKADVGITYISEATEYPSEGSGVDYSKLNQSSVGGHDVGSSVDQEDGSTSLVLEDATNNVPEIVLEGRSGDSSLSLATDFSSGLEREHREEQVTDVGAMQEFGSSSGYPIDDGMVKLLDGDSNPPPTDTRESTGDSMAADSGNTLAEEKIHGATQLSKTDDVPSTVSVIDYAGEGKEAYDHSVVTSPLTEATFVSTCKSVLTGQERDDTSFVSNEEKAEVVNASGGNFGVHIEGTQASSGFVEVERSSEVESNKSLACKQIDLSSILDGSFVKLSQLAEIVQVLDDDQFRCLCMSRESSFVSSRNADKMKADDYVVHDAFERLKEHLYVTSLSKDAFQLQLSEHQKWINEICAVNSSLVEVQGKNETFSKEIVQCRDEIEKLVSETVELEKQLQSSKADAEVFAANVHELQNKLDMTQGEMSSIFSELTDCRNLVNALQSENENLNESLKAMTEEKNKFWEERGKFLLENEKLTEELNQHKASLESLQTLLQDDRKQLEQENYGMNSETSKLCADLTESKNTVEALKVENKNLNEILSSLSEERKKLEEEKTLVDHQFEKMSEEMIDCKGSSATLQTTIINLNNQLTSIAEEKSNLVEEKNTIFSEYEKQTRELVEFKVLEAVLQAECCNAINDLKEARIHIKHLTQENEFLSADADSARTNRSKYDSLKELNDHVQEANIELMVLYEAMRELIRQAVAQESELLGVRDALQKQEAVLKSENSNLREKMNGFQAQINELQGHSVGFSRDSDEMVASISNQLQALQAEVANRESIFEEEWNSVSAQILQTVGILDSTANNISANSLPGENSSHDVVSSVAASVDGACKVIEGLHRQLDATQRDCQEMSQKTDVALTILHRLYRELSELVRTSFGYNLDEAENVVADDRRLDLLHPDFFNALLDQLKKLYGERLELESANKQLKPQLSNTTRETDELQKLCLKSDTVLKLIDEIEQSVKFEGIAINADEPASLLEALIHLLVEKYREASQGLSLCTPLEMQVHDLQCQVEHLNFVLMEYGNENLIFKHSLKSAQEVVIASNSRVQEKVAELEQSEQRVSSLREKLSIAVTKGKGLISQRESLKQSLAETSKELEKCSQELLSKDARLHELEAKVKVYSEAGERMEALESELSYIRNSATALRESFLLKDSVLQRIEEILEDLELPEHFHSGDIIEKIDWLAKLVGSHSLPPGEWDQRSSAGGGSYSDAGLVGPDGLKEDMQPNPTSSEDLRRRYEELENRFYGLAEQNEMLEQSLMERNNLVQRWEEILNRVDMPSQLRSMEPEDKIQWLGNALSEAQNHSYSLQEKIDNLETLCGSLTADLEDSQRRTSELEAAFHKACAEKEILLKDLEILRQDNDESIKRIDDFAFRNENLQNEASMIQAQKLRMEEDMGRIEDTIRRLQEMVKDALQDFCAEDVVLGQEGVGLLEEMLRKLVEKHKTLLSEKPADVDSTDVPISKKGELSHTSRDFEEQDAAIAALSKNLEDSMGELMCLKEEKDRYMLTNQSILHELEEQKLKKKELEELFHQEEHKSASLREKLNVAVRKGKSLVQQRDGMKQVIGELNTEVERLKSEAKHTEKTINEYEEQIKNLFAARDRVQVMESENSFLTDRLAETERYLQEKEGSWRSILNALGEIDVGLGIDSGDPVERIREIGKYLHDLHERLDSLEQESRKSKRAAELLLAELNEVQERNDVLQDELAKAVHELSEVSREKSLAENAKYEALAHVEKLSYLHSEEKDRHMSEIMALESGVDNMRNDLNAIERELGDVLSKDLEVLYNVKQIMTSFLDSDSTPALGALFPGSFAGGIMSTKSENKVFMTQIDSIRERMHKHSCLLQEETSRLSEVVVNSRREYTSQKEFYESLKRDIQRLQSIEKERESELHVLQGNVLLLYETCASAISSLENWKEHEAGNVMASRPPQMNLNSQNDIGGNSLTGDIRTFNVESIKSMCDKLLLVVGDSISMRANELARVMEVGQSEMKTTITNLQKELQEKDIQRERICKELVNQIKEAETNAKNCLVDLQQATVQLHDSQRQLDVMAEEHKLLEQKMKELQDNETNSIHLQQKVDSLTDALAAKVQECEALMQALDEQEAEMENLANKIVGLENELKQKNKDLENLEASRAKALKKLSVTVSKFDELHSLSENLLSEVEKLQSQLQEKDGEISFLRQEITRCTNDALAVTQMSKKGSDEIQDLISWLDSSVSRVQVHDVASDSKNLLVGEYKEVLKKKILDLISELENLREATQNRDMLLQEERIKVEEMTQKEQHLKNSLREMESQLVVLQGVGDSAKATKSTSEIVEVEPMTNKWASAGAIAPQVRSLRKPNNDQVAIAIDMDNSGERLEDDDDKAHGFKSLTTSKIVPRFTRPVSDMVDGLWVSCDRALMRQPALRLGVIIYWAVLHAMLATFVV